MNVLSKLMDERDLFVAVVGVLGTLEVQGVRLLRLRLDCWLRVKVRGFYNRLF